MAMSLEEQVNKDAYQQALNVLKSCLTSKGYMSGPDDGARLWTRDSIIAGLAGLASGDSALIDGMERTLNTLAANQGPHGEIPLYVSSNGEDENYGQLAGSVDALLWYVVGVCAHFGVTRHPSRQIRYWLTVEKAMELAACWEYNHRGFIYTPMMEQYVQQGYVLSNQLLYAAALGGAGVVFNNKEWQKKGAHLQDMLAINYWPQRELVDDARVYHPVAYRAQCEQSETHYWLPAFSPAGYTTRFDALAHALAMLSGLGSDEQRLKADSYIEELAQQTGSQLLPAFWPVIQPDEPLWTVLENNRDPGEGEATSPYNGGLWPMVTGLYTMGIVHNGCQTRGEALLTALTQANTEKSGFSIVGNAAAIVLAHQAVIQHISLWPFS